MRRREWCAPPPSQQSSTYSEAPDKRGSLSPRRRDQTYRAYSSIVIRRGGSLCDAVDADVSFHEIKPKKRSICTASARHRTAALTEGIRPLATRAASGIPHFDELLEKARSKAPARALVDIDDVGAATAFLALDAAKLITGQTLYVDGGHHVVD
ncbi:SDR family oxidoreductase [Rubrimonas cliftonensis]|uniref:SDR family oxidoreductase n=1 Tax=Rubrimonas cliftonensis TaxID=89524 RepID=UPI002481E1F5|nr:SDR family oxidoreductase [Rubrimonas cliftonensis]